MLPAFTSWSLVQFLLLLLFLLLLFLFYFICNDTDSQRKATSASCSLLTAGQDRGNVLFFSFLFEVAVFLDRFLRRIVIAVVLPGAQQAPSSLGIRPS